LPKLGDQNLKKERQILPTYEHFLKKTFNLVKKSRQPPFDEVAAIDLVVSMLTYIKTDQAGCAAAAFEVYRPSKLNRSSSEYGLPK
jgi:hypothetical protein